MIALYWKEDVLNKSGEYNIDLVKYRRRIKL